MNIATPEQTAYSPRRYAAITALGFLCLAVYLVLTSTVGGANSESPVAGIARWLSTYERGGGLQHDTEILARRTLEYALIVTMLLPAWILIAVGLGGVIRPHGRQVVAAIERLAGPIAIVAALVACAASLAISSFVFENNPITEGDEYCYTYQAKLFASGCVHTDQGANYEELENRAIVTTGPWRYAIGFPGHPLLLVPGVLIGWLHVIPAIFAGGSVLLLFLITKSLFGRLTAAVAAVLLGTSPFFLFFHGTLLPQSSAIFCLLLFVFGVVKLVETEHYRWLLLALVALAVATLVRVPSVMLWATPLLAYVLLIRRRPQGRWFLVGSSCVAAVAFGTGCLIWFAAEASGRPIALHMAPRAEGTHSYTEGYLLAVDDVAGGNRVKTASVNTVKRLAQMNLLAFGFPVSFLPLGLWFVRTGKSGWELMFLTIVVGFGIFYFLYTDPNLWYYLDTVPLLAILSACGVVRPARCAILLQRENAGCEKPCHRARASYLLLVPVGLVIGVVGIWPSLVTWFEHRNSEVKTVVRTVDEAELKNALVLLDGLPRLMRSVTGANSPDLDDNVIYAKMLPGEQWRRTVQLFPGRKVYLLRIDEATRKLTLSEMEDLATDSDAKVRSEQAIP